MADRGNRGGFRISFGKPRVSQSASAPKPVDLPSLRKGNVLGLDPTVSIVPSWIGAVWGSNSGAETPKSGTASVPTPTSAGGDRPKTTQTVTGKQDAGAPSSAPSGPQGQARSTPINVWQQRASTRVSTKDPLGILGKSPTGGDTWVDDTEMDFSKVPVFEADLDDGEMQPDGHEMPHHEAQDVRFTDPREVRPVGFGRRDGPPPANPWRRDEVPRNDFQPRYPVAWERDRYDNRHDRYGDGRHPPSFDGRRGEMPFEGRRGSVGDADFDNRYRRDERNSFYSSHPPQLLQRGPHPPGPHPPHFAGPDDRLPPDHGLNNGPPRFPVGRRDHVDVQHRGMDHPVVQREPQQQQHQQQDHHHRPEPTSPVREDVLAAPARTADMAPELAPNQHHHADAAASPDVALDPAQVLAIQKDILAARREAARKRKEEEERLEREESERRRQAKLLELEERLKKKHAEEVDAVPAAASSSVPPSAGVSSSAIVKPASSTHPAPKETPSSLPPRFTKGMNIAVFESSLAMPIVPVSGSVQPPSPARGKKGSASSTKPEEFNKPPRQSDVAKEEDAFADQTTRPREKKKQLWSPPGQTNKVADSGKYKQSQHPQQPAVGQTAPSAVSSPSQLDSLMQNIRRQMEIASSLKDEKMAKRQESAESPADKNISTAPGTKGGPEDGAKPYRANKKPGRALEGVVPPRHARANAEASLSETPIKPAKERPKLEPEVDRNDELRAVQEKIRDMKDGIVRAGTSSDTRPRHSVPWTLSLPESVSEAVRSKDIRLNFLAEDAPTAAAELPGLDATVGIASIPRPGVPAATPAEPSAKTSSIIGLPASLALEPIWQSIPAGNPGLQKTLPNSLSALEDEMHDSPLEELGRQLRANDAGRSDVPVGFGGAAVVLPGPTVLYDERGNPVTLVPYHSPSGLPPGAGLQPWLAPEVPKPTTTTSSAAPVMLAPANARVAGKGPAVEGASAPRPPRMSPHGAIAPLPPIGTPLQTFGRGTTGAGRRHPQQFGVKEGAGSQQWNAMGAGQQIVVDFPKKNNTTMSMSPANVVNQHSTSASNTGSASNAGAGKLQPPRHKPRDQSSQSLFSTTTPVGVEEPSESEAGSSKRAQRKRGKGGKRQGQESTHVGETPGQAGVSEPASSGSNPTGVSPDRSAMESSAVQTANPKQNPKQPRPNNKAFGGPASGPGEKPVKSPKFSKPFAGGANQQPPAPAIPPDNTSAPKQKYKTKKETEGDEQPRKPRPPKQQAGNAPLESSTVEKTTSSAVAPPAAHASSGEGGASLVIAGADQDRKKFHRGSRGGRGRAAKHVAAGERPLSEAETATATGSSSGPPTTAGSRGAKRGQRKSPRGVSAVSSEGPSGATPSSTQTS